MNAPVRFVRRHAPAPKAFLRTLLSTESPSEGQTEGTPSTDETPRVDSVEVEEAPSERYRTNRLLPKSSFLFPAKPRFEQKHLHLRALRRSKFSTSACLQETVRNDERQELLEERKCVWCGTPAVERDYFCPQCNKVLPVERCQNLFQIFDLEVSYDIDLSVLESKYKSMQMKLHPDRFAAREQLEQDFATAQATAINKAYQKLKDPLRRGKYLLGLLGFEFDEEQTISDPEFLMEMLDIQERVAEALEPEDVKEVISDTFERKESLQKELLSAFAERDLERASEIVTELSYLQRILDNARDKL